MYAFPDGAAHVPHASGQGRILLCVMRMRLGPRTRLRRMERSRAVLCNVRGQRSRKTVKQDKEGVGTITRDPPIKGLCDLKGSTAVACEASCVGSGKRLSIATSCGTSSDRVHERGTKGRVNDTMSGFVSFLSESDDTEELGGEVHEKLYSNQAFEDLVIQKDDVDSLENMSRLDGVLIQRLNTLGMIRMTNIQSQAIPLILSGMDVMLRSETGSGKTLAFLVPAIELLLREHRISGLARSSGTKVLILAPTRELVHQTLELAQRLTSFCPRLVTGSLTGGDKRKSEKTRLRRGITLLGSTVGRLCDHLNTTQSFVICNLRLLILDEADRLLDMGFEPKLRWIVNNIKQLSSGGVSVASQSCTNETHGQNVKNPNISIQTVLVSATLTPAIERLARFLLRTEKCMFISQDSQPSKLPERSIAENRKSQSNAPPQQSIPKDIEQFWTNVTLKTRLGLLASQLYKGTLENKKVVVFCSNSHVVEFYFSLFQSVCYPSENIFYHRSFKYPTSANCAQPDAQEFDASGSFSGCSAPLEHAAGTVDKSRVEANRAKLACDLGEALFDASIKFFKLHGNLTQIDRYGKPHQPRRRMLHIRVGFLHDFNRLVSGGVLFTTDVAARGLNFEGVQTIVQCDPPQDFEDYVHRVGRTGRMGKKGVAILFLLEHEKKFVDFLKEANVSIAFRPELELLQPLVQDMLPQYMKKRRLQNPVSYFCSFICRQVEADLDLLHSARRAFSGCYRAYRCYSKTLKPFFNVKNLHLGHLATSLGLSESPSVIGLKCRQGALSRRAQLSASSPSLHLHFDQKMLGADSRAPVRKGASNEPRNASRDRVLHLKRKTNMDEPPTTFTVVRRTCSNASSQHTKRKRPRYDEEVPTITQKSSTCSTHVDSDDVVAMAMQRIKTNREVLQKKK